MKEIPSRRRRFEQPEDEFKEGVEKSECDEYENAIWNVEV